MANGIIEYVDQGNCFSTVTGYLRNFAVVCSLGDVIKAIVEQVLLCIVPTVAPLLYLYCFSIS